MKKFKQHTLSEYLEVLSSRAPVPGGGSVSALAGSLAVGLLEMVANYSVGKAPTTAGEKQIQGVLKKTKVLRGQLLKLVDKDAESYLKVVKARKQSPEKYQKALKEAASVAKEICRLSNEAIGLAPILVMQGNKNLIMDVQVACELLLASYNGAKVLSEG